MMKNYFKPNSKSFKVIEMLNEGKSYDEAAKAMGYKHKNAISGIVSRWKLKDRRNKKRRKREMMKNYFKPDSKSFKVIELLNAGKSYDEIAKTMKYKNKNPISCIVSRWKLKDRLAEKKKLKTEDKNELKKKRFKAYEIKKRINWKLNLVEAVIHTLGYQPTDSLNDIIGCKIIDVTKKGGLTALSFVREGKRHILFIVGDALVVTEK